MLERDLQKEINRINGALEMLGLLHERLQLQRDELAGQSGQEAVDEMLTHVDALRSEYLHRQQALHPQHKTCLFLLTEEGVQPVPHDKYISLIEGKSVAAEFFGQKLRLADWYVRMEEGTPKQVVNENYSWLVFDQQGRLALQAAQDIEISALPTEAEREQINKRLSIAD
jgi:hypothetical protein